MARSRRWGSTGLSLLILATGAVSIALRYRGERVHGSAILLGATTFAIAAGAVLIRLVANRRTSVKLIAFASVSILAATIALIFSWASDPCRYQYCVLYQRHSGFVRGWAAASALSAAALWCFFLVVAGEDRDRWREGSLPLY